MSILCVIGARSGSKSIKDKNLSIICGMPLLEIAVKKYKGIGELCSIAVSSDSDDYLDLASKFGADHLIKRPPELSGDQATEFQYIQHALDLIDDQFELVLRTQCTSPFQKRETISSAIDLLIRNFKTFDSVQVVSTTKPNIGKSMTLDDEQRFLQPAVPWGSISPSNRQTLKPSFMRSNAYVVKTDKITATSVVGNKSGAVYCDEFEGLDIDSLADLRIARLLANDDPSLLGLSEV